MTVEIKGMDKLLRKLHNVAELRGARRGLAAGALHIKGWIAVYAPSTIANSPSNPSGRWYERGSGPKWRRKDGSIGSRKTSETLGRKWTTASRNGGLTQVIGNNVSYGPYVQSAENQAAFHEQRNWRTDEQAVEKEGGKVLDFVKSEIDRELEQD